MAAFTVRMPVRHESRKLVCAWSKGYECQCDARTNGCCAKESHAEIAEKVSESLPPGTLAGHWVLDRGDSHPAGGFAEKLGERTALYRAATQPTSGKGVGSLSTVELRNRSRFLGTGLSIRARKNGSRSRTAACNAVGALKNVVTSTLSGAGIELDEECSCGEVPRASRSAKTGSRGPGKAKGTKGTRKSRSTKIQHATSCLGHWVPDTGSTVQEPDAGDERGQAIRAHLLAPCAGGKPFLVQAFKGDVAICGCHCSSADASTPLCDVPEDQAVVKIKPGALPKGVKQLSRERVLDPAEQAGRTRSGEAGRNNLNRCVNVPDGMPCRMPFYHLSIRVAYNTPAPFARMIRCFFFFLLCRFAQEYTLAHNAATCRTVPPYIKVGATVLHGKHKPRIVQVVHVGIAPRGSGDQCPAVSIRLAGKVYDVPVESLREPPPPPPPLTFDSNPGVVEAAAQCANELESQNTALASKLVAEQKNAADATALAKEATIGRLAAQQELLRATKCKCFPQLRKELKLHWDACLAQVANSPGGECGVDFMSMAVAKVLLEVHRHPFLPNTRAHTPHTRTHTHTHTTHTHTHNATTKDDDAATPPHLLS